MPTLRYVWTNGRVARGAVFDNPYMPGVLRNLVLRNGRDGLTHWVTERRDLRVDFEAAFGRPPRDRVRAIALFTDNDQTGEPVVAYYGPVTVFCGGVLRPGDGLLR